jgi:hypothetical protein
LADEIPGEPQSAAPEKNLVERISDTNLFHSFRNNPIRARKVGGKIGPNSIIAFEKLTTIAASNDIALNRAVAECLKALGLCSDYKVEDDFGNGLTRRTDIVLFTVDGSVRLEMMWRKKTSRAEIANYVLTKLYNYGKAIGYLA